MFLLQSIMSTIHWFCFLRKEAFPEHNFSNNKDIKEVDFFKYKIAYF